MANNLSNALGTQMQFQRQPQNVYQRRLIGRSDVNEGAAEESAGIRLAQALGVFGTNINATMVDQEHQREKMYTEESKRVRAGMSEDDIRKYNAIEYLNSIGRVDLAQSPYAVKTLEEWRGNRLGAEAHAAYGQVVAEQGYMKTAAEEASRYDKHVKDFLQGYNENTSMGEAFNQGYFENFNLNTLQQIKAQQDHITKELIKDREDHIQYEVGRIGQMSLNNSIEEILAPAQELFRGAGVTGVTPAQRRIIGKAIAEAVGEQSGDPEKVKALRKIELYPDENGNPVLLGDVVDDSDALQKATVTAHRYKDTKIWNLYREVQELKSEEILPYIENLKKTDEESYRIVAPDMFSLYSQKVTAEKAAAKKAAKAVTKQHAKDQSKNNIRLQLRAWRAGQNTDGRYPIAHSISDLPKNTFVDEEGNTASHSSTSEEVYEVCTEEMIALYSDPKLSQREKTTEAIKILAFGPAKDYMTAIRDQTLNAFDTANADTLVNNMNLGSVWNMLELYEADNGTISRLMGPEVMNYVHAVRAIQDTNGCSREDALGLFAQGRERVKDPILNEMYRKNLKGKTDETPSLSLNTMDGGTANLILTSDSLLLPQVTTTAMYLQGTGQDINTAFQATLNKVKENYWIHKGNVFPKAWFSELNVEDKGATAMAFIDSIRQKVADDPRYGGGGSVDNVIVMFNPYTNCVEIKGYGGSFPYNHETFTTQANQYAYGMYTEGERLKQQTPLFKGETALKAYVPEPGTPLTTLP